MKGGKREGTNNGRKHAILLHLLSPPVLPTDLDDLDMRYTHADQIGTVKDAILSGNGAILRYLYLPNNVVDERVLSHGFLGLASKALPARLGRCDDVTMQRVQYVVLAIYECY
jgi:hypothetical protein